MLHLHQATFYRNCVGNKWLVPEVILRRKVYLSNGFYVDVEGSSNRENKIKVK